MAPDESDDAPPAWAAPEDPVALNRLMPLVYEELRALANLMLSDRGAHLTLQPTSLVHEAYLRLRNQRRVDWQDRLHFFRIAARAMRRVLVDHCRSRVAQKRGGELIAVLSRERPGRRLPRSRAVTLKAWREATRRCARPRRNVQSLTTSRKERPAWRASALSLAAMSASCVSVVLMLRCYTHLEQQFGEVRQRFEQVEEQIRHLHVLVEGSRAETRLLGEGMMGFLSSPLRLLEPSC